MKKTAGTIIAERKAIDYFCVMPPVQAKKVLFAMTLLKGDQRMGDSNVAEVRKIASFYEGVINANFAKELATLLAAEYNKMYPGVLMTKKQAEAYTDARYRKLYDAVGFYGFDYVVSALRMGKAYVTNPENGIDEKSMLQALRWVEYKEDVDKEASNYKHRNKGLQLVGLNDMKKELYPYTFIIASVYELVTPGVHNVPGAEYPKKEKVNEAYEVSKADMVVAFIDNAHLLKDYYGTSKPVVPEGFPEEELREGSTVYALATKGMLNDSEAVLKYVDALKKYDSCKKRLADFFSEEEIRVITDKAETVKEILQLVDSL